MLCASPGYLDIHGAPRMPADLKKHQILHYANPNVGAWRFTTPEGRKSPVRLTGKMASNNGEFLRHAAIQRHGIILGPTFMLWEALRDKKLIPLLCGNRPDPLTAYAIYPQTRHLPLRVRTLIDLLAERLKSLPYWEMPSG